MSSQHTLYIAWQDPDDATWYPVARIGHSADNGYVFEYIEGVHRANETKNFPGIAQFPDLERYYQSDQLFAFLKNRVIPQSRGDYSDHTRRLGLDVDELGHSLHTFELLARSNGRRATDRFEVFAPPIIKDDSATFFFFTRGIRYLAQEFQEKWQNENPKGPIRAKLEPNNPADPFAVQLTSADHFPMGYVPQYYSKSIFELLLRRQEPDFSVIRRNPAPAPTRERLLIRANLQVPQDWKFDAALDFKPISRKANAA